MSSLSLAVTRRRVVAVSAVLALVAGLSVASGTLGPADAAHAATDPTIPAPDGVVWRDTDGNTIDAHGGSVVQVAETEVGLDITGDGDLVDDVWLWYGEDKTNATRPVDGIRGYWSTDLVTWHNMGLVLPSHQFFALEVSAGRVVVDEDALAEITDLANLTAPSGGKTQAEIDTAKAFVAPYVETWVDEAQGIAATYDEANLANAVYRLNGNINIMERPKMLYNASTGKFVLIYHADGPLADNTDLKAWVDGGGDPANRTVGSRYSLAEVGFAVSDTPWGPFKLVNTTKLNWATGVPNAGREGDSRDMTVFQDAGRHTVDAVADDAYIVYSSEINKWTYISRLNAEYTGPSADGNSAVLGEDFSNRVLPDTGREASSVFTFNGWYYMLTSGTDGWNSTPVIAYRSRTMITDTPAVVGNNNGNPATGQWERLNLANPCVGHTGRSGVGTSSPAQCFDSQPTFVITKDAEAGQFIYMGDRWLTESSTGSAGERSSYVWAPIQIDPDNDAFVTVENPGRWNPNDPSMYRAVEIDRPLVFRGSTGGASSFAPTFDVVANGTRHENLTAVWSSSQVTSAFSKPGSAIVTGHIAGTGPLAQRYLRATVLTDEAFNACRAAGTTVTASFWETRYATNPPSYACDGSASTVWSTWASTGSKQSSVTFTATFVNSAAVSSVTFTNTEGVIAGVDVEYRDSDGVWNAGPSRGAVTNSTPTTIAFAAAQEASGIRLTFETVDGSGAASFLKIPEVAISAAHVPSANAELSSLTLDGTDVDGFERDAEDYTVAISAKSAATGDFPAITAVARDDRATVEIEQATADDPIARVTVTAEDGVTQEVSTVEFVWAMPQLVVTPSSGWRDAPVLISASVTNTAAIHAIGAEVTAVEYRVDGGSWANWPSGGLTVTETTNLEVRATTSLDDTISVERNVNIDVTPPTVAVTLDASNVIRVDATDAESGVAAVELSLNGGATWGAYTEPQAAPSGELVELQARATDNAGHVTTTSATWLGSTISATNLNAGDEVDVRVAGFVPGESVTVEIHSEVIVLPTRTANADGIVAFTFVVPTSLAPGSHQLILSGSSHVATIAIRMAGGGSASGGMLATTGADINPVLAALAGILLLGGAITLGWRARRTTSDAVD